MDVPATDMDVPATPVDWRSKGFWLPDGARTAADYATERPSLFDGGFTWPVLVLRQDRAEANIRTMAGYARRHHLHFAPHAKTTMAPGLIAAQFAAGAWGMTVATAGQALVLRRLGVTRILIANQVLDDAPLRWLAGQTGAEIHLQVDSLAGVAVAGRAAAAVDGGVLRVLVELGYPGGRTGVRTLAELAVLARAVSEVDGLELSGVTGYEGQLADRAAVDDYLDLLAAGVTRLAAAGLLPDRTLVSAGCSTWFDRVIDRLGALPAGCALVLRSGASVTHDDGLYRANHPFLRVPAEGPLTAALEVWAQVLSTPEPGLALAGMGRRDVPFDSGLPVPVEIRRPDGTLVSADGIAVTALNDHHAYLSVKGVDPVPGDLIRFGISHPCTAFDKWRAIPVVDAGHRVIDVLHTYF